MGARACKRPVICPQQEKKACPDWELRLCAPPPPGQGRAGQGRAGALGCEKGAWGDADGWRDRLMGDGSEQHRPIANDTMAKRNKRRFFYDG